MEGGGQDTAAMAMEMEVEAEAEAVLCAVPSSLSLSNSSTPSPSSSISSRRLGLKNSIQTNFGDDYVFQIASCQENTTLAVSLSTNALKFYCPATGQYLGECTGHSGTIHEISFSAPSSPQVVCSCSSDGTIRAWDTRSFKQISVLRASHELFSFSFGGSNGNLIAAGSNCQVLLWDWRNSKQLACLEESHMDDVTQVKFAPHQHNKLISAAVDGLICVFDTDGDMNEDNHLLSVLNVETSVAKVGFFGNTYQKLWCLTHIETLSTWDWNDGSRELNIEEARSLATDRWNLDHVDYFVDCHYSLPDDKLWVIGGTTAGTIGYFPVRTGLEEAIGSAEAILEGGHTDVVRTIYPAASTHLGQNRGIFGWTGGEDGRLCCWRSDEIAEINKSWISSSLVSRVQKKTRNRHLPY
ncbi:WD repeat-containing protein GTS1 isoform X1 [Oryza brachyantha]|uniref:WD repeat-containing protein GTS1 isoform X1 n=1 Tax=Oryza brachyantha TaxID=4533 RepID=UPI0003EADDCD|nr:WD repeat-containing protein GTS1 isoform X1 [Oryza brachyantha]